jgi:hypothetical protein
VWNMHSERVRQLAALVSPSTRNSLLCRDSNGANASSLSCSEFTPTRVIWHLISHGEFTNVRISAFFYPAGVVYLVNRGATP